MYPVIHWFQTKTDMCWWEDNEFEFFLGEDEVNLPDDSLLPYSFWHESG